MKKWNGYSSELTQESYDVIIIGSGIGGLCSAALLSMKGKKVLVLEKHFKIGGWTHTFRRKNYEWDVGIHYIGKVHKPENPIRKLFDLISDGKLEWCQMNKNYDRIIFPDQCYDFVAPRDQFINNMLSYFPDEESAIKQYMKLLDETVKSSRNYFTNKAIPGWIGSISYQLMNRKFFKYSDRTTLDVLSSLTNNKKLIGVLTGQWGDYGLPPGQSSFAMHALVAHHYLDGGNYPRGTSRKIAETISDFIEKNGGKLLQISTDYIFDGNGNTPYNINANSNPQNIYGKSKDLAEKSIRRNFSHQNKFIILRTSWVMSPYGKNFLLTMVNLLKTKSYIEVIDDQIGSMTYTKNLAKVCWQLIETNKEYELKNRNFPSTHHWCEKGITTWFNIACVISQICKDIGLINNPAEIRPVKTIDYKVNAKRPKYSVLNCEETERLLNIKSANWEKSLFDILLELKNNSI